MPWVPAREIEAGIAVILRDHLMKPIALVEDISASEIPNLQAKLHGIAEGCDHDRGAELWAPLLRRADISQGRILLRLDRKVLAEHLGIKPERISSLGRQITAPFRVQRRGVETKIVLGAAASKPDPVPVKNILNARRWYKAVRKGASFITIAEQEKTTSSRIQQMICLAFLAPDILDQIAAGTQPVAFTSERFKTRHLPSGWNEQRKIIGGL